MECVKYRGEYGFKSILPAICRMVVVSTCGRLACIDREMVILKKFR
jgi:hypothetical protein